MNIYQEVSLSSEEQLGKMHEDASYNYVIGGWYCTA